MSTAFIIVVIATISLAPTFIARALLGDRPIGPDSADLVGNTSVAAPTSLTAAAEDS